MLGNPTIEYIKCLSCDDEWVTLEDEYLCDKCTSKFNVDIALVTIHAQLASLTTCSKSDLLEKIDLLETANGKLAGLINQLKENQDAKI